jgi:TonB-dependent SusC/RagA subfamily outer membrane receptor
MRTVYHTIILLTCFVLISCNTSKDVTSQKDQGAKTYESPNVIDDPQHELTLASHLRKVPGVNVRGDGQYAQVTIRGKGSINSSNEPLFVVDGTPINGGYQAVVGMISVQQIQSIKVLKNAGDLALYGVRGANGVIEIRLKR